MRAFIGLGSNLKNRRENLEAAARLLGCVHRTSPVFETPALVPQDSPVDWRIPYLNAVAELEWPGSAQELFQFLKKLEQDLGRTSGPRWSPRLIDLDLLLFGDQVIHTVDLQVPHAEMLKRSFVLDPLKHLDSSIKIQGETVLQRSRNLSRVSPLWMGILNVTPDSFSDGGELAQNETLAQRIRTWIQEGVQVLDLGAESTRPGAVAVTPDEEWRRLEPALQLLKDSRFFRPWVSVDTRHATTAVRALEAGADIINDVSGLSDPALIEVLQKSDCQYVLMHSLSVPADPKLVLPQAEDPVWAVKAWALEKIEILVRAGIPERRIIFDPGVGFGKTPLQSLEILQRIEEFFDLPVRILVGHSRKSFINLWGSSVAKNRDPETLAVSLNLAGRGVDILRVHQPVQQQQAFRIFGEINHENFG